ncbi:nSTAND1 domain-containing NTPase [Candidatus Thiosymbion oneisti]|uniref:nSTAND1 domain-containing NTPase n=1 Tax=Candidatus Thiosymbion oneisti TaxID=589554 RepID=UPI000B1302CB|nr:AAA family ATPase [Candidatus Thiosymbion oneisti]
MTGQLVSSPASTGGAGTFFEQHVVAYWLAQLLVRGIPPILIETSVAEVHLQTEHLGWHTDDFLIVCEGPGAADRKLAGQVKRSFTVSTADEECRKAILDFWKDFKNSDQFSPEGDRLVLVTRRGTNTLLEHFVGLLDCARAARDGAEFEHRLATKGFISNKVVHYCDELRKIIAEIEGSAVAAADIWPFLRVLHVLSLDLHTSTRQTEAQIRSLLAYTVTEADAPGVADASWNALLALASTAMPEARSLCRADLPQELRNRHGSLSTDEQRILRALKDHTAPVLRRIRSTIGQDLHLQRAALVQQVLGELETAQVVLVSGPAGSGKSVVGKAVVSLLSRDHFAFGFRVEEFAEPHIDATLHAAQIPTNAEKLAAILAAQGRKLILIESVERLLEKTTRDAFSDLMAMAAADRSMCIVLTCRDYSTDLVRAGFLQPAAIDSAIVSVPPLADAELAEVEEALPALVYPLKNRALRSILCNPYFLDKALEISWSAKRPVPESEREFRALFWRRIVRADQSTADGMARRREEVFEEIAVRRARALSAYVSCKNLDPEVVAVLRKDSLIVSSDENPSLVATAHDVLEDWAILQWLEEQHLTDEGSFRDLSDAIGPHPAIRRSYRKWIAELFERDPGAADCLFRAAISETEISARFRDDTLVSLLKAPSSPGFLTRHEAQLLANDRAILKRVIRLLHVACVTTPAWLTGAAGHGPTFNVPDGPAWTAVLRLVHRNIDSFTPQERLLLLGLIEDAVRNVSWWAPELEGAEYVAGIGHWLLAGFDNYRSKEPRMRVLKVIAKIPKADAVCFGAILHCTEREDQQRNDIADDFRKILFCSLEGMSAARDLPDLMVSVATDYLLASEEELRRDYYSHSSPHLGTHFGIKDNLQHNFFPASALRGPWLPLLQHNPRQALDFFIHVFNHSADWYAHPRVCDPLEPAWEIELTFADGTTRKQWGNQRFWNLYRGTSVGPDVLRSLLMALERWLLELADKYPKRLDAILVDILRRSESAALAAVVAGVATAHPRVSGEALLVLLSAPDYIVFDRGRIVHESGTAALSGMLSLLQADNKVYEEERKEANRLPHRREHLETAVLKLQLGPFAPRVHAILDRYLAALPPKTEQKESDRVWRLAIHRMDLRRYTVSDTGKREMLDPEANAGEAEELCIRLEPKPLAPNLQAMVDESAAQFDKTNSSLGVLMWGRNIFERKEGDRDPSQWRQKLAQARTMEREIEDPLGSHHGPGFIAAVCVRDHWDELSTDEQDWCVNVVCSEIAKDSNHWNHLNRVQQFSMAADRPCAQVVSLLLNKSLPEPQMQRVRQAFAVAITHSIEEVRQYAAQGINEEFWATNGTIALRCVNAIAMDAGLVDRAWEAEKTRPYELRRRLDEIRAEAAATVRRDFWQEGAIPEDAHTTLDTSGWFGTEASVRILTILGQVPNDPIAVDAFLRASRTLVGRWDTDNNHDQRRDRDYRTEAEISERLQQFLMRTTSTFALKVLSPMLDAIDRHPHEIHSIVEGLTLIEDREPNTERYWSLWGLFADGIKHAKWIARLDKERPIGSELLSAIFLTSWWKDNVRHWRSLEGHAHRVHALFEDLPPVSIVLDGYVRFLYHIGEQSLPNAFIRVADSLERGDASAMLAKANTVFLLEVLLQRHVYGRPLELKRDAAIRQAVLSLLDRLVEAGSSAAFRMRDDFVTPAVVAENPGT